VSPQEAADMLSVDRDTVFRWIKEGKLAAWRLSPRILRVGIPAIEAAREHVASWLANDSGPLDVEDGAWLAPCIGGRCWSFIYVLRAAGTSAHKIGVATDPAKRVRDMQTGCPTLLEIVLVFRGNRTTESAIHQHFAAEWLRGEWFTGSPRLLDWIERERSIGKS
jgi:excisionase family DNA binding protein